MKHIITILFVIFSWNSYSGNGPIDIKDDHQKFDIIWTMALVKTINDKKETIHLSSNDLKPDQIQTDLLSDLSTKRSCSFKRSLTPKELQKDEWYQVVGNLTCQINELKIKFNPILCDYKVSEDKEMSNSSSVRIKNGNEDLYFMYGCNVIKKIKK